MRAHTQLWLSPDVAFCSHNTDSNINIRICMHCVKVQHSAWQCTGVSRAKTMIDIMDALHVEDALHAMDVLAADATALDSMA